MLIHPFEIIKNSLVLYQKNWRKFSPYIILLLIPSLTLTALGVGSLYLYLYVQSSKLISSLVVLSVFVASMIFSLWVTIALAKAIKACLDKEEPKNWKENLGSTSHLIWPVIITYIIAALIILGGTILFIIPGIIFFVWYTFNFYTVIFEEKTALKALRASKNLVVGRWWSILFRWLVPVIFVFLIILTLDWAANNILGLIITKGFFWQSVINGVINSIINTLAAPITLTALLILYLNAKNNPTSASAEPNQRLEPPQI